MLNRSKQRPSPAPIDTGALPAWSERDIDTLQSLLDSIPAPLEPLDVSMLDGYLCGVLLQPRAVPEAQWWPPVCDTEGRALPPRFDARALHALVLRRYTELNQAIIRRQWFDPWVFEMGALDDDRPDHNRSAAPAGDVDDGDDDAAPSEIEAVYPWVAGFAAASELFPALMQFDAAALTEPLALLYRHLDADDLEDADELLAEIDTLEPPEDLAAAVEELVRATLLLADISRPLQTKPPSPARRPGRPGRPRPSGAGPRR